MTDIKLEAKELPEEIESIAHMMTYGTISYHRQVGGLSNFCDLVRGRLMGIAASLRASQEAAAPSEELVGVIVNWCIEEIDASPSVPKPSSDLNARILSSIIPATKPARVKPLDLANLLRHAFMFGFQTMGGTAEAAKDWWPVYDPEDCPAFDRIRAATLSAQDTDGVAKP